MTFRSATSAWDDEDWDILDTMYHEHTFHLVPSRWSRYSLSTTLNWHIQLFDESNARHIPTGGGIYAFCVEPRISNNLGICYVMYFGKANNLRRRFGEYTREIRARKGAGRSYIKRLKHYKSEGFLYFYFAPIDKNMIPANGNLEDFIKLVEDGLIAAFTPPVNKQILDAEVRRVEAAF